MEVREVSKARWARGEELLSWGGRERIASEEGCEQGRALGARSRSKLRSFHSRTPLAQAARRVVGTNVMRSAPE